jgi:hypothetical protein
LLVTGNTWFSPPTDWPESGLVGEMYAGFIEPGDPPAPLVVQEAPAWLFAGTGLRPGSKVPGVVWADFDHVAPGWPMPDDLEVLAHSPVPLSEAQTSLGEWGGFTYSDMTYYTSPTSGAGVFDTGTTNWIFTLTPCESACPAPITSRITDNLLRLFGRGPAGRFARSVANWQQLQPAGS